MTTFLRALAAVTAFAFAAVSNTASADQRPALVEIANFDCPYCYAINKHHPRIKRAAERAGMRFVYAPVPSSSDYENAWRERAYYAARHLPGMEKAVRDALLQTQEAPRPVRSLDEVTAWLDLMIPQVRWRDFANDHVAATNTTGVIERSVRLALAAGADSFPSFLIVSSQGVELIPLPGDTDAMADGLIAFLERYSE